MRRNREKRVTHWKSTRMHILGDLGNSLFSRQCYVPEVIYNADSFEGVTSQACKEHHIRWGGSIFAGQSLNSF